MRQGYNSHVGGGVAFVSKRGGQITLRAYTLGNVRENAGTSL
jgi:hypothetical protein